MSGLPRAACVSASPAASSLAAGAAGLAWEIFPSAASFLAALAGGGFAAVLADRDLPDMSGDDLVLALRRDPACRGLALAEFSLSSRHPCEIARVLDTGADEYFCPPLDPALIGARLLNIVNRPRGAEAGPEPLRFGGLELDMAARSVSGPAGELKLTSLEFDMLVYFILNANRVVTRGALVEAVWKRDLGVNLRAVDKRVEVLRSKLGAFASRLQTVFGLGYILRNK